MDHDQQMMATGLHHLPLRVRDSSAGSGHSTRTQSSALTGSTLYHPQPHHHHHHHHLFKDISSVSSSGNTNNSINSVGHNTKHKRCPETLSLLSGANSVASRLRSPTESSLGSIPDSATTYSPSTIASPLSSSYASDLQDMLAGTSSRPASRVRHRHRPSTATCSTFVNDEDEVPVMVGCNDHHLKLATVCPGVDEMDRDDFGDKTQDDDGEFTPQTTAADEALPVSPSTPIKTESTSPPLHSVEDAPESPSSSDKWDTGSVASDDDCTPEDAESILDFTLQLVYGVDTDEASVIPEHSRELVQRFVRELGQSIWQSSPQDTQVTNDGTRNSAISSSSSSSTPAGSSGSNGGGSGGRGGSQRGGKRKKQSIGRGGGGSGGGDDDGDDMSEGDGDGFMPVKRVRPNPREDEANLRLSCPFRKRNPHRFNVRDHHSCAMTFFPKFAELRQHIVKQHKREDPSAFVCDRCNRDFISRKELRDHQRLPRDQMCDISDVDPESGIDGPTSNKLLSRKRASGSSADVQWREIWNILFPDDDDYLVRDYHFTPVIEHFELSNSYLSSFAFLKADLGDKMSNPATLETLATKFHQCFVETVERCINEAQTMPYANRSNKRNEQLAAAAATTTTASVAATTAGTIAPFPLPRKMKDVAPRPDSGVVMDDGSEESGSVLGGGNSAVFGGRLSQRESMRTVRGGGGRRGSSLAPMAGSTALAMGRNSFIPPSRAPSAIYDGTPLSTIPATSMGPSLEQNGAMAPTDVQAWTHGVPFPPHGYEPMPDNFVTHVPTTTAHGGVSEGAVVNTDLLAWAAQTFYPAMGGVGGGGGEVGGVDHFAGFQGR